MKAVSEWRITTVLLFGIGLLLLANFYQNPTRILWALSLTGFWHTLALGQIYAPLLILAISAWILAEKGYYKLAGLALGAISAMKPNFAF